jgi:YihY family inner membrane protein
VTPVSRLLRNADRFQQGHRPVAFAFGVVKKFGDDRGGSLAALVTYYGFLSIFPLLLILVTVLGLVAGGDRHFADDVQHSALAQFPIIGNQLRTHITGLRRSSPAGLAIGLAGLLWGSLGASQSGQFAMAQIWNVPIVDRPGFLPRLGRSLALVGVLGVFLTLSTALAGLATFSGSPAAALRVVGAVSSVVVNVGLFATGFRILTPRQVAWRDLVPGAVVGGVVWTGLQGLGGYLVGHELRNASQIYGFFGIVLGLLWWIYLAMRVVLYSAEINVVRRRRLWPRSLTPPLTTVDRELLVTYARQEERRREQHISVGFHAGPVPAPGEGPPPHDHHDAGGDDP